MTFLVDKNKIFDTKTATYKVGTKADKNAINVPIIFNVRKLNGVIYCDVADAHNVRKNQKYDAIKKLCDSAGFKPIIVGPLKDLGIKSTVDEKPEVVKVSKKLTKNIETAIEEEKKNAKKEMKAAKADGLDLKKQFTKDSKKERKATYKENLGILKQKRYIDHDNYDSNLTPLATRAKELVDRARYIVKEKFPIYYLALQYFNIKFVDDPEDPACPTMGVSADTLYINSDFTLHLKVEEIVFILCHEASHIILKSGPRLMSRNHGLWNCASDLIINIALCKDFNITPEEGNGTVSFFKGGLWSKEIDCKKETAETVYNRIVQYNADFLDKCKILELAKKLVELRMKISLGLLFSSDDKLNKEVETQLKQVDKLIEQIAPLIMKL